MKVGDDDTTIGTGGWVLVVLSGIFTFAVLRGWLYYLVIPAGLFSVAIALIVLLVLHRLAVTVNRYDDQEEARRVRKVVPATSDVGVRIGGTDGATAPVARAMPARAEGVVAPQRPSSVVTPLARLDAAPTILPPGPGEPAPAEGPVSKVATKAGAKAVAEPKPKATKARASTTAASATGAKPKAEKKPKAPKAAPQGLVRLKAPRKGKPDDLQEIEGIGPALEKLVNSLGFYHFDQIAAWTEADVALVDGEMQTFKGRIARDKWVDQARIIVSEGLEAFRERARANDY